MGDNYYDDYHHLPSGNKGRVTPQKTHTQHTNSTKKPVQDTEGLINSDWQRDNYYYTYNLS